MLRQQQQLHHKKCTLLCALSFDFIFSLSVLLRTWDDFDVVARSAAAWMNISAASNFLKQLSERASATRRRATAQHTPDKHKHTCMYVCVCVYLYTCAARFVGCMCLCWFIYNANVAYVLVYVCVCVYVLCTETTSYIYLCTYIHVASFGLAIRNTLLATYAANTLMREQCCCAVIAHVYKNHMEFSTVSYVWAREVRSRSKPKHMRDKYINSQYMSVCVCVYVEANRTVLLLVAVVFFCWCPW